jgi:hypothetical protein
VATNKNSSMWLAWHNHVRDLWAELFAGTPFQFQGEPFHKFAGGVWVEVPQPSSGWWVRAGLLIDNDESLSAGPGSGERTWGHVSHEIFHPRLSGAVPGMKVGDAIATFYRGAPLPGFQFRPTKVASVGEAKDDAANPSTWWKTNAVTPFDREFTPS